MKRRELSEFSEVGRGEKTSLKESGDAESQGCLP